MWRQNQSRRSGEQESLVSMLPWWSITLAIIAFLGCQYFFFHVLHPPRRDILPFRMFMSYSWGTALASYFLMIGYVTRDVRRRNMSAALWTLIVLIIPGGIGAVVYFLLRSPILMRCPSCSTEVDSTLHFCPQCAFQFAPVCGRCYRGVEVTDVYCVTCGHDLAEDSTPARLRVYSD